MELFIKPLFLVGCLCIAPFCTKAQSYADVAGLFSEHQRVGTARMQGTGYGMTGLGGELSIGYTNPAANGMFNKNQIALTAGVNTISDQSTFLGTANTEKASVFNVPYFGVNFYLAPPNEESIYKGGSFNISFSRISDFNRQQKYSQRHGGGSIVEFFEDGAFGYTPDELPLDGYSQLAYDTYIIDDSSVLDPGFPNDRYWSPVDKDYTNPNDIRNLDQEESIRIEGKQYAWSIGYGANLNDMFFVGANIGITSGKYRSVKTYSESNFSFDLDPEYEPLRAFTLEEILTIRAKGINFSGGVIVRPLDVLQLGFSIQSPTYYTMNDEYDGSIESKWNDSPDGASKEFKQYTSIIISEYKLNTPLRMNAGAAFFIGKRGFISADAEFVDYSSNVLKTSDFDPSEENNAIQSTYNKVVNIRAGVEIRLKQWKFRGGVQHLPSISKDLDDQNGKDQQLFSLGLGYSMKKFFMDLAGTFGKTEASYSPHPYSEQVLSDLSYTNITGTIGLSF